MALVRTCGIYKKSYEEDEAIFQTGFSKWSTIIFLLFLAVFPLCASEYLVHLFNIVGIAIIAAVGLNILTGFTGQISVGHAALIGTGAYSSAILTVKLGISFWLALPLSGIIATVLGIIIGLSSLRIKGLYLLIATLAAHFIMQYIFSNWTSVTGGSAGLLVERPSIGGLLLKSDRIYAYLTLICVLPAVLFAKNLFRGKVGRAFVAIRDRDLAAEIMGINIYSYKLLSFAISSFYAGIAGCLWAHFTSVVHPETFPLMLAIEYLAMIIIGGLGSIVGTIFGTMFVILTPEFLQFIGRIFNLSGIFISTLRELIFGLLIVFFLVFEPDGLARIWERIKEFWKLWPFPYPFAILQRKGE